jgi:gliding motility-associated lipoprotein GldD
MRVPVNFFHTGMLCAILGIGIVQFAGLGCKESPVRIPKPRTYPRITFPERNYVEFHQQECPLTFQYPNYMQIIRRDNFFDEKPAHPCWFDLDAPSLGARLHCSYYPIESGKGFDELVTDAFKMADRINQRANYMDEIRIANAQGLSGLLMEFSGSAASPLHFYMTDSTRHFLKASLYFQSKVIPDSLAPITNYLREDLAVIINSMKFE